MVDKRENHYNWKGGRYIDVAGYARLLMPEHPRADCKGYVHEHRVVMEKKIGRLLVNGECVHHINHDRADNRPDNLMLFSSSSEHSKYEMEAKRSKLLEEWEKNGKHCWRCGLLMPIGNFVKPKLTWCKNCERIRHAEWRQKKKEHLKIYGAQYRESNRDRLRKYAREWRDIHEKSKYRQSK